jgi:sec-independent protein translocase protein TatC
MGTTGTTSDRERSTDEGSGSASYAPDAHGEDLARMSLGDHLEELRSRVFRALLAIAIGVAVFLPFKREVTAVYTGPYKQMWRQSYADFVDTVRAEAKRAAEEGRELDELDREALAFHERYAESILDGTFNFSRHAERIESLGGFRLPYSLAALGGISDFWVFMAATVLFGLLVASPFVLYQGWAFVAAGLYRNERKAVLRYFPLAAGLLITGILFGYFVVVPYGLYFLVQLMNFDQVVPIISVTQYFSMLLTLTGALGACFQLPLVMLAIAKIGLVTPRAMRQNWRYVVLTCFVLGALLTPPDPFTQAMMAGPMILLYIFGLFLTAGVEKDSAADGDRGVTA